jgi:hypothetical protein
MWRDGHHETSAMDAERWRNLERLYHPALERERKSGARFYRRHAKETKSFAASSNRCSGQDVEAKSPRDWPAWENASSLLKDARTAPLEPGMQVGPYRIGTPIGAGAWAACTRLTILAWGVMSPSKFYARTSPNISAGGRVSKSRRARFLRSIIQIYFHFRLR